MKTIEIKLFTFDELTPEVQEKVIKKNWSINIDDVDERETIAEYEQELVELGFTNAKIYHSGYGSQGDGLSFDAIIDMDKFCDTIAEKRIATLISNGVIENFKISKTSYANHYCHEYTRYIDVPFIHTFKASNVEAFLDTLKDKIEAIRLEHCQKYYRALETTYYSLMSEESIKETLIANEYTYREDGTMFNE